MRLPGRSVVPAEVASVLPDHSRPLAAARAADGTWLVGTRDELFLVPPGRAVRRVAWEEVESATWDREAEVLRVAEVGEFGQRRPMHAFVLSEAATLLAFVRERVTASVLLERRGDGFTVVARRPPGGGEVRWSTEYDEGVEPGDPAVEARVAEVLTAAAGELGTL
jgi:hypothetical protein